MRIIPECKARCLCAGKGWYNLNESNYETYCFSKMKSLLVVTRFMMEDTLRSLVLDNHTKFVAFVQAACAAKVGNKPCYRRFAMDYVSCAKHKSASGYLHKSNASGICCKQGLHLAV